MQSLEWKACDVLCRAPDVRESYHFPVKDKQYAMDVHGPWTGPCVLFVLFVSGSGYSPVVRGPKCTHNPVRYNLVKLPDFYHISLVALPFRFSSNRIHQ